MVVGIWVDLGEVSLGALGALDFGAEKVLKGLTRFLGGGCEGVSESESPPRLRRLRLGGFEGRIVGVGMRFCGEKLSGVDVCGGLSFGDWRSAQGRRAGVWMLLYMILEFFKTSRD